MTIADLFRTLGAPRVGVEIDFAVWCALTELLERREEVAKREAELADERDRCAAIAHASQDDCLCADFANDDAYPCIACLEAARIEGRIRGTPRKP